MVNNKLYKILLVDDETDVLEFIGYNLEKEHYTVFKANDGKKAIKIAIKEQPHLIILDLMMPGLNGFETCKLIREHSELKDVLIIFLSARNDDYAQIAGFEAGADDYIGKPIKLNILKKKIEALLRRITSTEEGVEEKIINAQDVFIDKEKRIALIKGKEVMLSKKEFDLLFLLISKPNIVFSRDDIINKIWDDNVIVGNRTIDVHIRKIREKTFIKNIKTVKGVGYKYVL